VKKDLQEMETKIPWLATKMGEGADAATIFAEALRIAST